MSDLPPRDPPHGDGPDEIPDMAAAELALGLLDGEERAAAVRRVLAEPGFARAVERWRLHLAQLFDLWPAVEAPDLFDRIERSLDRGVSAPIAAFTPVPRREGRLWPAVAGLSSLAAAVMLVLLVSRPVPVPQPRTPAPVTVVAAPTLVAAIDPEAKGVAAVTAVYDAQAGAIRLTEAKLVAADHSAELWVIPADGTPHSLGVLHTRGVTALALSPDNRRRIAAGAVLAVTVEPVGGSPTGLPTGPVVAKGALAPV